MLCALVSRLTCDRGCTGGGLCRYVCKQQSNSHTRVYAWFKCPGTHRAIIGRCLSKPLLIGQTKPGTCPGTPLSLWTLCLGHRAKRTPYQSHKHISHTPKHAKPISNIVSDMPLPSDHRHRFHRNPSSLPNVRRPDAPRWCCLHDTQPQQRCL